MLPLIFIDECGILRFFCAMHVFDVRASSSSPRLPLCQISFLSHTPLLSQPVDKKLHTGRPTQSIPHSVTHPAYLMPQEPKLSLCNIFAFRDFRPTVMHQ